MIIDNPPVALSDNLWMLGSSAYPLYWFQAGGTAAVFEGGTSAMGPLLQQQIAQLGLDPNGVELVVITHGHPDHVMAVPLLRQMFPRVVVAASAVAARTLSSEKALAVFGQIDEALTGALLAAGAIGPEHRRQGPPEKQIAVDRILNDGEVIHLGEFGFRVLATPGHSDCSLSFYEPRQRILLLSDATGYYLPQHDFWWPNYFGDYGQYLASMRRLAELDVELLCLSHNAAVRGADAVREYFRNAIAATEQYHERILAEVRAGKAVRPIAEMLGAEVYEKTRLLPLDFFQKNCGLLVKHSLRHAGMGVEK